MHFAVTAYLQTVIAQIILQTVNTIIYHENWGEK